MDINQKSSSKEVLLYQCTAPARVASCSSSSWPPLMCECRGIQSLPGLDTLTGGTGKGHVKISGEYRSRDLNPGPREYWAGLLPPFVLVPCPRPEMPVTVTSWMSSPRRYNMSHSPQIPVFATEQSRWLSFVITYKQKSKLR